MPSRLAPAFGLFQVAALIGGWALFVSFGTLPAVIPALSELQAAVLIVAIAVTLTAAFAGVLTARSLAINQFRDVSFMIGGDFDKAATAFIHGPGLLSVFCLPLLSLLLVAMISVAGPLASAIALGLVIGGIMSAANGRAVIDAMRRAKVTPAPLSTTYADWRRLVMVLVIMIVMTLQAVWMMAAARVAALRHAQSALVIARDALQDRERTLTDAERMFGARRAHEDELLKRETARIASGHASQFDIDSIRSRLLALNSEAIKTRSEMMDSIARTRRDIEDLSARETALLSIAPALTAR